MVRQCLVACLALAVVCALGSCYVQVAPEPRAVAAAAPSPARPPASHGSVPTAPPEGPSAEAPSDSPAMATGSDGAYLGCFVDSGNRDLRVKEFVENGMSVEVCGGLCREQGARYFGLEEGRVCLCGNSYGRYGPAPTKDCNVPCPGNSSETCGAQWRSSVYRVAAAPALPLVSSAQGGYLGCFFDSGNRDLRVKEFVENGMSVEVCAGLCREQGAQYAGLEDGRVCLCGNSYGRYGSAPAKDCNVPCPGNSKQTCGAPWRSSVYKIAR